MPFDMERIEYNAPSGETTAELIELRSQLSDELAMAINDGNVKEMLWLDEKIKSLEPQIFAAKIENLKQMIELNAERKTEIVTEIEALRAEKQRLNGKLARAIRLTEKRGLAVTRADFSLQLAESELETVRVSNREMTQKLEQIKQNKLGEIKRYETEFRTNF